MSSKIFQSFLVGTAMLVLTSCIVVDIKGAGVFKEPIKYDNRDTTHVEIPSGVYGEYAKEAWAQDSSAKIKFNYFGKCGGDFRLSGVVIPFVPWFYFTSCEEKGFYVSNETYLATLGVTLQLRYNSITYNPYIDKGSVKFKIPNFSEFKKAQDKTLIIHKRKPDGTIFTKELPFDWKVVVETSGGL